MDQWLESHECPLSAEDAAWLERTCAQLDRQGAAYTTKPVVEGTTLIRIDIITQDGRLTAPSYRQ